MKILQSSMYNMERLKCYICKEIFSGGLNGLRRHFINNHGLTINKKTGDDGYVLGKMIAKEAI